MILWDLWNQSYSRYTFIVLGFADFCKKMLMLEKFFGETVGNSYQFFSNMSVKSHAKFEDCTTFCLDIKTEKKEFLIPYEFHRKTINV